MKSRTLHSLSLRLSLGFSLLWLALPPARAQTADDIFHDGAVNYFSNNIPKALEVVTNGRAIFPDDIKLKNLEELLKQQSQQQQQQQQSKNDQQKQDEKKDQQSKQDQQNQSKDQKDQQKQGQQQAQSKSKPEDKEKDEKAQSMQAHAMTPQEAKQLLDAQKGDEQVLVFKPPEERKTRENALND